MCCALGPPVYRGTMNMTMLKQISLKKSVLSSHLNALILPDVAAEPMRLTSPVVSPPPLSGICHIQIVEEPEEKFRFRYKSEMQGTHGCIHGRSYTKKSKKFPTIQIQNVPLEVQTVRIRVALYTNEKPRNHHVHKVMWKQSSDFEQNFVEFDVSRGQGSGKGFGRFLTSLPNSRNFYTLYI